MEAVRCRRCARTVWQVAEAPLEAAHCGAGRDQLYSSGEQLPDWVAAAVEASAWQTGRLLCVCGSPLGSFDFVSGRKCECGETMLPPVHLNLKKVDYVGQYKAHIETLQSRQQQTLSTNEST